MSEAKAVTIAVCFVLGLFLAIPWLIRYAEWASKVGRTEPCVVQIQTQKYTGNEDNRIELEKQGAVRIK